MWFSDFFNFFSSNKKNDEPHYDSTNIRVQDLDVGFVFEYNLSSWVVEAIYEYDWGDNYFTREFKINDGAESLFLSVEEDDELELSVTKKVKVRLLGDNILSYLQERQDAPKRITYQGINYTLEDSSTGYFHDIAKGDEWLEFRSWDYEDDKGENILCIEQWDDDEFEASVGKNIQEYEISDILPSDDSIKKK